MTCFVDMLESGRNLDEPGMERDVAPALRSLHHRAVLEGHLAVEGVWRLHRKEAVGLEKSFGASPGGGWRNLCALAVGTGVLRAKEDAFVIGPEVNPCWLDDEMQCRRRLLEAFTRWLIPPSVAAALFLGLNVHPLWGLRLARRLHHEAPIQESMTVSWRDEELMPDEALAELRKGIFAGLSVIFSGLRRLQGERCYGMEALVGFVIEALMYGQTQIEDFGEGLSILLEQERDGVSGSRSLEIAAREIIDGVLIPAGAMYRRDGCFFSVVPAVLEELKVGHLGRDAQHTWFQCFLVENPRSERMPGFSVSAM